MSLMRNFDISVDDDPRGSNCTQQDEVSEAQCEEEEEEVVRRIVDDLEKDTQSLGDLSHGVADFIKQLQSELSSVRNVRTCFAPCVICFHSRSGL